MQTQKLAAFAAKLQYGDLSEATVRAAKQCFLDWLANAVRGSQSPSTKLMEKVLAREKCAARDATVFTDAPYRASAMQAALVNGMSSHSLDFDDLHNASIIHLATVVMPAALAVAERDGLSGRELVAAIVAGYEIGARVGETVNPRSYYFWHTTGTAGTFGAAAAAGRLLGLDEARMVACLGTAGTQAAGLWEFLVDGAMSKTLHAGKAAMHGILAADLSRAGFTAAKRILEGDKGFCKAMDPQCDLGKLTVGLGEGYKIDDNSFKPYACCKHCHPAINAMLELCAERNLEASQIVSIAVETNDTAECLVNNAQPKTPYGHKFSLQYCLAAAARYGQVGLDEFTEEKIADTEAQRLMRIVRVSVSDALQREFLQNPEKWSVKLRVETEGGASYSKFIPYPKGDPQNPVSYEESEAKFRAMARPVYDEARIEALLRTVRTLETIENIGTAFFA